MAECTVTSRKLSIIREANVRSRYSTQRENHVGRDRCHDNRGRTLWQGDAARLAQWGNRETAPNREFRLREEMPTHTTSWWWRRGAVTRKYQHSLVISRYEKTACTRWARWNIALQSARRFRGTVTSNHGNAWNPGKCRESRCVVIPQPHAEDAALQGSDIDGSP